MKIARKIGVTSQIFQIFIRDSSSASGGGLTGLAYNTAGLVAYYHRDSDTTATSISLVTMTVGTFTSSGFKEIDSTNMPGWYQFCPPNAALASGASTVAFHFKGATNMVPVPIEVDLASQVDVTHWSGSAVATPNVSGVPIVDNKYLLGTIYSTPATAGIMDVNIKNISNSTVSTSSAQIGVNVVNLGGTAQTGRDIGASVLLSSGTGTGQISLSSGTVTVGTNNDKTGYTASTVSDKTGYSLSSSQTFNMTGNITGNLSGSVGSVTGLTVAYIDAAISSRASQTSVNTIDDYIDTEIASLISSVAALPSAATVASTVLSSVIEGSITVKHSLQLANAANAGKTSGMAGTSPKLRNIGDTKDRVSATVDVDGNRTAITLDLD